MRRRYNRTMFNSDLTKCEVLVDIYDECKYDARKDLEFRTVKYTNVKSWDLIEGGIEAEEIEKDIDASQVDDYHEYLVLNFANGDKATFRNSYVSLFIF